MFRIVWDLSFIACLVVAAPTVHLSQSSTIYEDNTELPLILEPVAVSKIPPVEATYADPVNVDYQQPMATVNHQPAQLQPSYYYPLTHMNTYNIPGYHQQPSYGYQLMWPYSALPQQATIQTSNTNVLPCSQSQHEGGYQQHGY